MKKFLYELFSSDGTPSIRLASAGALIVTTIGLEIYFANAANVKEFVNSNFLAVGGYFTVYAVRKIGTAAASTPAVDNSKTNITAETAPVNADTVNMNSPAV